MHIKTSFDVLSLHREIVPAYLHRPSGHWIVTGTAKPNGGTVMLDNEGQIIRDCATKCDAVAYLNRSGAA